MKPNYFRLRKPVLLITASMVSCFGNSTINAQSSHGSDVHEMEEIVISTHPLHEQGLSQSVEVLRGEELLEAMASNLGDTLAQQPGIRSASFGAAAGRPVIHGLGGARVKTTEDRIDTMDVSVTSTDHAVTVEPFIADQISVLKGASTLLYGSGAIGGVVDTETGRIPTELNDQDIQGRVEVRASDNADGRVGAIRLDGNAGDAVAWHFDAFSKQADDYEIPSEAESSFLRALEEAEGEEHEEQNEGYLVGSRFEMEGAAVGVSWVGDAGHLGISVSTTEGLYGLVGGHGHGHDDEHEEDEHHDDDHDDDHDDEEHHDEDEHHDDEHEEDEHSDEEGPGSIDLKQTRLDLSARLNSEIELIDHFSFRLGINDYEHMELEPNGEVGTVFDNEQWEAQLQIKHAEIAGFSGVVGLQLGDREFSAIGEEAFVPAAETQSNGLYWVGEKELDGFSIELGGRVERNETSPINSAELANRTFTSTNASVGVIIPLTEQSTVSALYDYAERAPSIEELYANGPHFATQTFEIGDDQLDKEKSNNLTLSWAYETDRLDAHVTAYHNDFSDYIFQASTGEIDDELPVFEYRQADARFSGLDVEVGIHLHEVFGGDLDLRLTFDTVSAKLRNQVNANLPRIPADRIGAELVWFNSDWRAKLGFHHVDSQTKTAAFELPTESYDDISLMVERHFEIGDADLTAFIKGRNLSDEEQRAHTSFVKDFAPAQGRTIEAGLRLRF